MIVGEVRDGSGRCSKLMDRLWLDAAEEALGVRFVPGSLNVHVSRRDMGGFRRWPGVVTVGGWKLRPVAINGRPAYAKRVGWSIEVLADVRLRELLQVVNGDHVVIGRRGAKPPYQDVWRNGRLVMAGRRDCATRYEAIREVAAAEFGRGFSLVDIGGWDGYFARRFIEDLDVDATTVDARPFDVPGRFLQLRVTRKTIDEIPHADLILALSVLHHRRNWQAIYEGLLDRCRWAAIEVTHPDERFTGNGAVPAGDAAARPSYERVKADADRLLCETPASRQRPDLARPTFLVRGRR